MPRGFTEDFSAPHAPTRDNRNRLLLAEAGGCWIFGRERLESHSPFPTTPCVGTHKARSRRPLALGLKKGVTHTSDMA